MQWSLRYLKHTVQIDNGKIRPRSDQSLRHDQTQPARTTRHQADLALERKLGQGALKVHPAAALDNRLGGHLAVRGVRNLNVLIGSGEAALIVTCGTLGSFVGS